MYVENMHRLYGESDLRTVVVWKNIYACIENCMDEIIASIIADRNIYEKFSDWIKKFVIFIKI